LLTHSVNTWDQGFLDKLYSAPSPVGLASELLLAALNTNVHVYTVSPALTVLEKLTAQRLANLFGFRGPYAGGVTCAGGSASNLTSLITARSHLYPETKTAGNGSARFVIFTSAHGHYSVDKAAIIAGLGKDAVWLVPVDATGRMIPAELAALVARARAEGFTPLYVNATAGTTVLGSYDPFPEISAVCKREGLWMHVDASWGGPVVFSEKLRDKRLRGVELADSLTVNPHKMMNVPVTCSFLLGPDMRVFHGANRTDAPYLFHGDDEATEGSEEVWDLADLTLQCGRRGDAIKLALAWVYHGPAGFESQINKAFELASLLAGEIQKREDYVLVGEEKPPPCLQVCFYHKYSDDGEKNTTRTAAMVKRLRGRGFMVDYASFPKAFGGGKNGGGTWQGSFFRVVVNIQTRRETVLGLVKALDEVAGEVEA
ncbi:Glutamate decarboxylase 2, partial [Gnomoniopsis sp. IMI 355080]